MCDESKRAEKPEAQAAVKAAATAAPQGAAPATTAAPQVATPATTATPQVAMPATTAASQVTAKVAAQAAVRKDGDSKKAQVVGPEFARAENEDDDGYDPYSDRRPVNEPLFERDPWS